MQQSATEWEEEEDVQQAATRCMVKTHQAKRTSTSAMELVAGVDSEEGRARARTRGAHRPNHDEMCRMWPHEKGQLRRVGKVDGVRSKRWLVDCKEREARLTSMMIETHTAHILPPIQIK